MLTQQAHYLEISMLRQYDVAFLPKTLGWVMLGLDPPPFIRGAHQNLAYPNLTQLVRLGFGPPVRILGRKC